MTNWNYGDAYLRYPINSNEIAVFEDKSMLKVHDIFNSIPEFMEQADLIFVDPPWNLGNLNTFYTKAEIIKHHDSFEKFYLRLFECIKQINPDTCYIEIGKENLHNYIVEMKKQYKYVTFYNSSYYHKKENMCYVVRGSNKKKTYKLDYLDEEDIIEWVCSNEEYACIGDLCMGRGLVAVNAYKNNKKFVGTELNQKRLSVTIEKVSKLGGKYNIEMDK